MNRTESCGFYFLIKFGIRIMSLSKIFIEKLQKNFPQIIIVSLILLVYIQNLWFDLAYLDDGLIIYAEYDKINSLLKIPQAFLHGYLLDHYYRPIILISFIIDTAIAGQSSMMYHLTNLLLHILFSLMLFKLLKKFRFNSNIALISTLLFAVHPINTNAVSWIAGRNDLIVGVFSLGSFLSFLNYFEKGKTRWLIIHLLTFLIALYSKEIGIMVIPLVIIYTYLFERAFFTRKKEMILLFSFWSLIIFSYLYLRLFIVQINTQERAGFDFFIGNLYIILEYLSKLIYFPAITPLSIKNLELIILGFVIVILLTIITLLLKLYKNKTSLFGIIFFLAFILPTLVLSQRTVSGEFVYIDCRIYLPLAGLIIFISTIFENIKNHSRIINAIMVSFTIYSAVFTFIKSSIYRNGEKFWTEVTSKYPEVSSHWIGFGFYYFDNKEYLKAAELVEKAIAIKNDIPEYYHKASLAYEKAGYLEKSIQFLEKALGIEKDKTITLVELIKFNLRLGNIEKALNYKEAFEELEINDVKKKADLYSSLAYYFSYSGLIDQSIELMKEAIYLQPSNPIYFNDLGVFYYTTGKLDSAKHFFSEALKLDPGNKEFASNIYNISKLR